MTYLETVSIAREKQDDRTIESRYAPHTKQQKQFCLDALYADILNEGRVWDENLEGYRADMLAEVEAILFDREDDKLGRCNDAINKNVKAHCACEIGNNLGYYLAKYCHD